MGTILPVSLNTLATVGTGTPDGRLGGLAKALHNPDHTQHDQYEETNGDEPHEDHPDPAEWRVAPPSHHARSHHTVSAIAPTAKHSHSEQEEEGEKPNNHNNQPVDFFHIVLFLSLISCIVATATVVQVNGEPQLAQVFQDGSTFCPQAEHFAVCKLMPQFGQKAYPC